jgi:hypothetical protein
VFKIEPWFWEFELLLQICFHLLHLLDGLDVYGLTNVQVLEYMTLQCSMPIVLRWPIWDSIHTQNNIWLVAFSPKHFSSMHLADFVVALLTRRIAFVWMHFNSFLTIITYTSLT